MGGEINERTFSSSSSGSLLRELNPDRNARPVQPQSISISSPLSAASSSNLIPEPNLIDRGGRKGSRDVNRDALKARTRKERNRASPRWRWPVCAAPPPYSPGTPACPSSAPRPKLCTRLYL
jgi:hypothetical protein